MSGVSINEYSDVSLEVRWLLNCDSDDSDDRDENWDESLVNGSIVVGVIVSARLRGAKRPLSLGCVFQASVEDNGG